MLKHGLMPMRNLSETESPAVDTRMLEFVERRREEQARARRQRTQLIAIAALGVIGVVLTISNAVLVSRLLARPVAPPVVNPPPARSAAPPPVDTLEHSSAMASRPVPLPPEPGEPPASAPAPVPPAAPHPASRPPAASPDVSASARSMSQGETEPPALPERATRGSGVATATGEAHTTASRGMLASVETDPALRTARWMIHTYGPLDAESKALAAAQFYTGDERAFWRRVVRHVRTER